MVKKLLGVMATLSLLLAAPVPAHADTYAPGTDNQNFATGPGGWTGSASYEGLCVPSLLCATVTNDFVGAGGADGGGDGYIRTAFTGVVDTSTGASTGVWESPAFSYNGNAGEVPTSVTLDLAVRPQIAALFAGPPLVNDITYRVDVVDQATSAVVNAVPPTPLATDAGWTSIPTVALNPGSFSIGRSYRMRISTTYSVDSAVVGTGEVGYDNVRLTTSGNGGSGITTPEQLYDLVYTVGLPKKAKLVRDKLKIRVKCPVEAAPLSCGYSFRGLAKGPNSKVATARKVALIKAGHFRWVSIKVKPKHLAKYQKAKKVYVRAHVRVGGVRVTVVKKVRLRHKKRA